jgi:hypothetical protein
MIGIGAARSFMQRFGGTGRYRGDYTSSNHTGLRDAAGSAVVDAANKTITGEQS